LAAQNEALKRQAATNAQVREQAKKDAEQRREAAKAEKEYNSQLEKAQAIIRSMESPLDTFNRKTEETNRLREQGVLIGSNYDRVLKTIERDYLQTTDAAKALAAAEAEKQRMIERGAQLAEKATSALSRYKAEIAAIDAAESSKKIGPQEANDAREQAQKKLNAADTEGNRLREIANKLMRDGETPTQTLARSTRELAEVAAAAGWSAQEAQPHYQKLYDAYFQTTDVAQKLAQEEKDKNEEIARGVQYAEKAASAIDKYEAKVRALKAALSAGEIQGPQYDQGEARAKKELNDADVEGNRQREKWNKLLRESETPLQTLHRETRELSKMMKDLGLTAAQVQPVYEKLDNEYFQTTDAAQKLKEAEREKEAAIKRGVAAVESARSPHQKYVADMRDLRAALKDGKIEIDDFNAAQGRLKAKTREALGEGGLSGLARSSITQLAAIGTSYLGVQEAIQRVTEAYQDQIKLLDDVARKSESIAKKQEKLIQNTASAGPENVKKAIEYVDDINKETGVKKEFIYDAMTEVVSAIGADKIDVAKEASLSAANFMANNPDSMAVAAKYGAQVAIRANVPVEQAMAQLISGQSTSVISDFAKYAETVVKGASSAAESQKDRPYLEVLAEEQAIVGAFGSMGADPRGESTATADVQLTELLVKVFGGVDAEIEKTKTELAKINETKNAFEIKKAEAEIKEKELQYEKESKRPRQTEKQKLDLEELGLDIEIRKQSVSDQVAASARESEEAQKLRNKLKAYQEYAAIPDAQKPKSTLERLSYLSQNEAMAKDYLDTKAGEARFLSGFKSAADPNGTFMTLVKENQKQIKSDPKFAQEAADQIKNASKELFTADLNRKTDAKAEQFMTAAPREAAAAIKGIWDKVVPITRNAGLIDSTYDKLDEIIYPLTQGGLGHQNPGDEAKAAIGLLVKRRDTFERLGDEEKVGILNTAIDNISNKLNDLAERFAAAGQAVDQSTANAIDILAEEARNHAARLQAATVNP